MGSRRGKAVEDRLKVPQRCRNRFASGGLEQEPALAIAIQRGKVTREGPVFDGLVSVDRGWIQGILKRFTPWSVRAGFSVSGEVGG